MEEFLNDRLVYIIVFLLLLWAASQAFIKRSNRNKFFKLLDALQLSSGHSVHLIKLSTGEGLILGVSPQGMQLLRNISALELTEYCPEVQTGKISNDAFNLFRELSVRHREDLKSKRPHKNDGSDLH